MKGEGWKERERIRLHTRWRESHGGTGVGVRSPTAAAAAAVGDERAKSPARDHGTRLFAEGKRRREAAKPVIRRTRREERGRTASGDRDHLSSHPPSSSLFPSSSFSLSFSSLRASLTRGVSLASASDGQETHACRSATERERSHEGSDGCSGSGGGGGGGVPEDACPAGESRG